MTHVLGTSWVAPVLAEPRLHAEQVTQLLLGEGAIVRETAGAFLRVVTSLDSVEGWIHQGFALSVDQNRHDAWLTTAGWSGGGTVALAGMPRAVPHRARLQLEGSGRVRLPDGRAADILDGRFDTVGATLRLAQATSPATWAWQAFGEAPYQWGGLTSGGIDCSGLVQTTFLARGVRLPRDARDQATIGRECGFDQVEPGDLLCFRGTGTDDITHVAIADLTDHLVHASVARGRVVRESWGPTGTAADLRPLLAAVRRLT